MDVKIEEIRQVTPNGWKVVNGAPEDCRKFASAAESIVGRIHSFVFITRGAEGGPEARAISVKMNDGFVSLWFATHRSSRHAARLKLDSAAAVYFNDPEKFDGLFLSGRAVEETDRNRKSGCWRDFYTETFPGGIDDPEYLVFRFETERGNLSTAGFNVEFRNGIGVKSAGN
jgi:general stress protein 26